MAPSRSYRDYLRYGCRVFMEPRYEALLCGEIINAMGMDDLEALYGLMFNADPRQLAPSGYIPKRGH